MIPRYLIYWVNSIEDPSCALADDQRAFSDGKAICAIAGHLIGRSLHFTSMKQDAESKVRAVLTHFRNNNDVEEMPAILCAKDAAKLIVDGSKRGDSPELVSLLEYLFIMSARIVKDKENTYNLHTHSADADAIKSDLATLKQRVGTRSTKSNSAEAPTSESDSIEETEAAVTMNKKEKKKNATTKHQPAKRQNVVKSSYPLRKMHSRGRDSYQIDDVKADEERLVEEAVKDEQEGSCCLE